MKNKPCADHKKCIGVLNLIIDGEANKDEMDFFHSHINDCLECSEYYSLERSIRDAIRKKLEIIEAPNDFIEELRSKVKASIKS